MKKCYIAWFMAGIGGTVLYQQIKNGNMKKLIAKCKDKELHMVDELEEMM